MTMTDAQTVFGYLQEALALRDIDLRLVHRPGEAEYLMRTEDRRESRHRFDIEISDDGLAQSPPEFWETAIHELIHVATWGYDDIMKVCAPYLPPPAKEAAMVVQRRAEENTADRLSAVIARILPIPKGMLTARTTAREVKKTKKKKKRRAPSQVGFAAP